MRNAKPGGNIDKFACAVRVIKAKPITRMGLVDALDIKYDTANAWMSIMLKNQLVAEVGVSDGAKLYGWIN